MATQMSRNARFNVPGRKRARLSGYGASRRRTIKSCENARSGLSGAFRNFVSEKQDVRGEWHTRARRALTLETTALSERL